MKCPCCGSETESDKPLLDLNTGRLMTNAEVIYLAPRQAELLEILIRRMPAAVSNEHIMQQLFGALQPDDAYDSVKVHVCHLRKKIKDTNLVIKTHWGRGHSLEYRVA